MRRLVIACSFAMACREVTIVPAGGGGPGDGGGGASDQGGEGQGAAGGVTDPSGGSGGGPPAPRSIEVVLCEGCVGDGIVVLVNGVHEDPAEARWPLVFPELPVDAPDSMQPNQALPWAAIGHQDHSDYATYADRLAGVKTGSANILEWRNEASCD